jgi:hypothetical protein
MLMLHHIVAMNHRLKVLQLFMFMLHHIVAMNHRLKVLQLFTLMLHAVSIWTIDLDGSEIVYVNVTSYCCFELWILKVLQLFVLLLHAVDSM